MKALWWLVIALAAVVIIGAVVVLSRPSYTVNVPKESAQPSSDQATPAQESRETAAVEEILISEQGFSPATLTVKAGTTVRFRNSGQEVHDVASVPHPVHTDLPDLRKRLSSGDSYNYTFSKTGSWGVHDHLNPSRTATVTVE